MKYISPKTKISTKADKLRACLIFVITFALLVAAFVVKAVFLEEFEGNIAVLIAVISLGYAIILAALFIYVYNTKRKIVYRTKILGAICFCVALTGIISIFASHISVVIVPAALAAFLVSTFAESRDAFAVNLIANILIAFTLITEYGVSEIRVVWVVLFGILCGSVVSYSISRNARRFSFIVKGLIIGITTGIVFLGALVLKDAVAGSFVWRDTGIDALFIGGAIVAQVIIAFVGQPIIEHMFNLTTNARLVELTDHNHPLVKRIIKESPGTFNHCLNVANFAEICATAIGENPYLARACAYYHDVGKLVNPMYFKENQSDYNPHDELMPEVSADIIRNHTNEGQKLCDKYKIPKEVSAITSQHHGTLPIAVFYNKAKNFTDNEVDIASYSYHGPLPESKIAAIIMICDSAEAAVRALDNPDGKMVDNTLRKIISERITGGQFDDCDITMRDLDTIRIAIADAYGGIFHQRVKYPDGK